MTIKIIGAGLAGLLAANMLRHRRPVVHEAQSELPNNHSAVLRFRSSAVGDILNIPFQKVTMIKTHLEWMNPVADALAYSFKNGGKYRSDRSIIAGTTVAERWIAPKDLITRMAADVDIKLNSNDGFENAGNDEPIISTIPMPRLMELLNYHSMPSAADGVQFNSIPGANIKATIANCDAYISLLVPDPAFRFSRVSITGDELTIEMPNSYFDKDDYRNTGEFHSMSTVNVVAALLGINSKLITNVTVHRQKYAKITPIDDDQRKAFMHWATDKFGIYSLGRFATWRPVLLLDDLINDLRLIDRWIGNKYAVARHR